MNAYRTPTTPRRPGSDDFKSWPSRIGDRYEAYSPPVGPCAKSVKHATEQARKRSVQWGLK